MVEAPREHLIYLRMDGYYLGSATMALNPDEIEKLKKYGHWLEALAAEVIVPFTPE